MQVSVGLNQPDEVTQSSTRVMIMLRPATETFDGLKAHPSEGARDPYLI